MADAVDAIEECSEESEPEKDLFSEVVSILSSFCCATVFSTHWSMVLCRGDVGADAGCWKIVGVRAL